MTKGLTDISERKGGCLCGAVRYRITAPITEIDACHCGMCRKHTGGIALGFEVPPGGIEWQETEALRLYQSSKFAERGFCGVCGSGLFWRATAEGPEKGLLSLGAGSLDDLNGLPLTTEIYTDCKPDGYAFAGALKQMTEQDVLAAKTAPDQGEQP